MELGERFKALMIAQGKGAIYTKKPQKVKGGIVDANHFDFIEKNINSNVSLLGLVDNNVCVYTPNEYLVPMQMQHLHPSLTVNQKNDIYRKIRREFRKYQIVINYKDWNMPMASSESFINVYPKTEAVASAIDFLYEISGGKSETLIELAKLCAHILKYDIPPKPIVLLADKITHQSIKNFIDSIQGEVIPEVTMNDFLKNHILFSLYAKNLCAPLGKYSTCAAVIIEGKITETEASVKRLSDIMTGKVVSIAHPSFPGKLYVKNKLPFIFITASHEKYIKLKNIYRAHGIIIPAKKELIFSDTDKSWFRNCFAAWGEKLINEKTSKKASLPKISDDDIFGEFIDKMCLVDSEAICAKAELYKAYVTFYKRHYGNEPLGIKTFGRRIACYKNLESVRPHSSRTESYRHCFKGITIDPEKYNSYIKSGDNTVYSSARNIFEKFLCENIQNAFVSQMPPIKIKTSK